MNLRNLAKGKLCLVRLPGICNGDPATTVLAHFRMSDVSGMSIKSPDVFASWACSSCHDAIDRRSNMDLERDYVRLAHLEGVVRTQLALLNDGTLTVKGSRVEPNPIPKIVPRRLA